jgi:hypothetical protein
MDREGTVMFDDKNWDKIKERHSALWEREIVDRCCASISAPYEKGMPLESSADISTFLFDPKMVYQYTLLKREIYHHLADAYPIAMVNLGPAGHAGYFKGAKYRSTNISIWFDQIIFDYEKDHLILDKEGLFYSKTLEVSRYLADHNNGQYVISLPDCCGNLDALAALRGTENLLIDLFEGNEYVIKSLDIINNAWISMINEAYDIIKESNKNAVASWWLDIYTPGLGGQLQCDIATMLSPQMFETYAMPDLIKQSEYLDYPFYHLDGMEQIRHLDLLLSIDKLKMIQWTSVAGQPSPVNFMPVFKKIQNAGKCLLLMLKPTEVETILKGLSSKGLFLKIDATSVEEAEETEKLLFKYTKA